MTWRSVLIGIAAVGLIAVLSAKLDLWLYMAYVTGATPPGAQTYILFALVLIVALMVCLGARRLALTRGELLVLYLMMLVGGPISNREGIGYLVCHPVIPYYYSTQETQWAETFHRYLSRWFGPSDRRGVRGFFEGRQDMPWGAFYVALFGTMFCFNALVEKQWIDRERLTFPLLYLPLELTRNVDAPEGGKRHGVLSLLYQRGFWIGVAIPSGFCEARLRWRYCSPREWQHHLH